MKNTSNYKSTSLFLSNWFIIKKCVFSRNEHPGQTLGSLLLPHEVIKCKASISGRLDIVRRRANCCHIWMTSVHATRHSVFIISVQLADQFCSLSEWKTKPQVSGGGHMTHTPVGWRKFLMRLPAIGEPMQNEQLESETEDHNKSGSICILCPFDDQMEDILGDKLLNTWNTW